MLARPDDVPDDLLVSALSRTWGLGVVTVEYLPVGFGSHHWRVLDDRNVWWFATVDDLRVRLRGAEDSIADARIRLRNALVTTRAVADSGASFVVAPVRRQDGEVLEEVGKTYAIALYPYVKGRRRQFGDVLEPGERRSVIATLGALHATDESTRRTATTETFDLPQRQLLRGALDDRHTPWDTGPYAEPTRELLVTHAPLIEQLLARHDQLATEGRKQPDRMVLTHGEPHPGNLIETSEGWRLVDWDTALLAPPERDLWFLQPADDLANSLYTDVTGRALVPSMLTYYRDSWALNDIAAFISQFRQPHEADANNRAAWTFLAGTLGQLARSQIG